METLFTKEPQEEQHEPQTHIRMHNTREKKNHEIKGRLKGGIVVAIVKRNDREKEEEEEWW